MTAPALKEAVEQLSALAKSMSDTELTSYKMPGNTANIWSARITVVLDALSSQSQAAEGMAKALEASTTDLAHVDSSLTAMADGGHAPASGTWGFVLRRIDANRTALSHYRTLGEQG